MIEQASKGQEAIRQAYDQCSADAAYLRALVAELEKDPSPAAASTAARHRAMAEQVEARAAELAAELRASTAVLAAEFDATGNADAAAKVRAELAAVEAKKGSKKP